MMKTRRKNPLGRLFSSHIRAEQVKDTGMAMVLIFLLAGIVADHRGALITSSVLLLIDMIWPPFFKPVAHLWIGFSRLLGTVMSKIVLTLIFFLMVTPVGTVRRWLGADAMQMKKWKQAKSSAFRTHRKIYQHSDLEKPY